MSHFQKRPVAVSLRLYRALARAFPYEFKNAYGEELQVTEDAIEPIWQRHGVLGLVRLLADIAVLVPIEHLAELHQDVRYGLRMLAKSADLHLGRAGFAQPGHCDRNVRLTGRARTMLPGAHASQSRMYRVSRESFSDVKLDITDGLLNRHYDG